MKLSRNLTKEECVYYIDISLMLWGCVPVDVDWAIETKPFKRKFNEIFEM